VRSGPEQQSPLRACEQGGASSSARSTEEKQRGDVKRAGASARTSEHDRASSSPLICQGRIARPAPHASCTCGALVHATRTGLKKSTGLRIEKLIKLRNCRHCFETFVGNNIISPFVALEDHAGIRQFPDVEEEVSSPQTGQLGYVRECPGLSGKRLENLKALDICDWLKQVLLQRLHQGFPEQHLPSRGPLHRSRVTASGQSVSRKDGGLQ